VNVQSEDGSEVVFWVVDPLVGHPILGALAATPSGFSTTGANSTGSLDYVKAPSRWAARCHPAAAPALMTCRIC